MINEQRTETLDNLSKAQELIRDPKNWTQQHYARDADGHFIDPESIDAVSWCAKGALHATGFSEFSEKSHIVQFSVMMLEKAFRELKVEDGFHYRSIMYLNDDGNHDLIMKLYDRAKKLCVEPEEPVDLAEQ